ARLAAGPDASEAMVQTLRAQYGLDRSLGTQFVVYTRGLLRGDFGLSLRSRNTVADDLARFFPNSFELVTLSLLLAVAVGVPRGQWATLGDGLRHAVLPVVTLSFPALASILRVNRAEMLETLHQDYILNARAQGLGGLRVVAKLALRNAMIPTLTMIGLRY